MDTDYYYFCFWSVSFEDFPIIPHILKFVHNMGKDINIKNIQQEDFSFLVYKFCNNK